MSDRRHKNSLFWRTSSSLVGGLFLCGLVSLVVPACSNSPSETNAPEKGDPELRAAILANLGEEILVPHLEKFETLAEGLKKTTLALANEGDSETREAAQESFLAVMSQWQLIEMMQLGPLATETRGGQELRVEVYSWPIINSCRVDQLLVDGPFDNSEKLAKENVNSRGLDALEYLLFNDSPGNSCADLVDINANGTWDSLDASEIEARRSKYAATTAQLIAEQAVKTTRAYADKGGFVDELKKASDGGKIYSSSQDAFNDWATALFYLDTETKDMKLAQPASIMDCPGTCRVESVYAHQSTENLRRNLESFDLQFFGGTRPDDAEGLDDLLADIGHKDVADDMEERIISALKALNQIEPSLAEAISEDPDAVTEAFDALKSVTDLWKTQVLSLLSLSPDADMGSDSD